VLAVVHGDPDPRREELRAVASRIDAGPEVEVIDRETMATIQRLVDAGVLSMNEPRQTLHGTPDARTKDARQQRLATARRRLAAAERKLGMARLLAEGGFEQEAAAPLGDALDEALAALADSAGLQLPTPVPLAQVRAKLAPRAGFGDDTLALLALLREEGARVTTEAVTTADETFDRISVTLERQ
jgi:hypothetical protein